MWFYYTIHFLIKTMIKCSSFRSKYHELKSINDLFKIIIELIRSSPKHLLVTVLLYCRHEQTKTYWSARGLMLEKQSSRALLIQNRPMAVSSTKVPARAHTDQIRHKWEYFFRANSVLVLHNKIGGVRINWNFI